MPWGFFYAGQQLSLQSSQNQCSVTTNERNVEANLRVLQTSFFSREKRRNFQIAAVELHELFSNPNCAIWLQIQIYAILSG